MHDNNDAQRTETSPASIAAASVQLLHMGTALNQFPLQITYSIVLLLYNSSKVAFEALYQK